MTPQEQQLVTSLFARLASLEGTPRDPDAERAISEGLRRAPHAIYALVQSVLLQDEALTRADARIRELETGPGADSPPQAGFLDTMRDALFGRDQPVPRTGSVPSVPPPASKWGGYPSGMSAAPGPQAAAAPMTAPTYGGGGSFLGTAAASAAGVVGGALLLNSFHSMFSGMPAQHMLDPGAAPAPWNDAAGGSDLARDAGIGDIGRGGDGDASDRQGFLDTADNDSNLDDSDDGGFDAGGGDSDIA